MLKFEITHKSGKARRGRLTAAHGVVDTPAFMPVGTCGTVKAMRADDVANTGAQILLGNTYHLMLRPGADIVQSQGGLHKFMGWDKPILTDCGGFQVMSLAKLRKITEDGVTFASHINGARYHLTPEISVQIQHKLDSNITMALDECPKLPCEYKALKASVERSMRWEERSLNAFIRRDGYGIFAINQGGTDESLRRFSADILRDMPFDGIAIGGLAVGEGQKLMFQTLDFTPDMLPENKPRYLMGVGRLSDIIGGVQRGVDMFDCVMPTRSGRTALAFLRHGGLNMRNARFATDGAPIDETCQCYACRNHSRAYIHHLFKAQEILGAMLLTQHNLTVYQQFMHDIRMAIQDGTFQDFAAEFWENENRNPK